MKQQFAEFFNRDDSFTLGVCNGCQMLSTLHSLIPGADHWPRFVRNQSEQFEARLSLVQVEQSPSILLAGMLGARIPVAVSHGEGRAELSADKLASLSGINGVSLRFVDNYGRPTEAYPANANGSPGGLTGVTSSDGRVTIMMPHPERVFRTIQNSWAPGEWGEDGAWMQIFYNARQFAG